MHTETRTKKTIIVRRESKYRSPHQHINSHSVFPSCPWSLALQLFTDHHLWRYSSSHSQRNQVLEVKQMVVLEQTLNGHRPPTALARAGSRSASSKFWSDKSQATHQMACVAWGPEVFSNKVTTSCLNCELISWDFGSSGLRFGMSAHRCIQNHCFN